MDGYAHRFIYPLISLDYYQALIYVVLLEWFKHLPSSLAAVVFMIGFRWAAIRWDLTYPRFLRLGSER